MKVENTAAIVTGAASGLGAATAAHLASRGARVFGLDLNTDNAPAVEGVSYIATDVTDEQQVRAAVAKAAASGPLRVVVNCAGIGPSARILGRKGVHDLGLYTKVIQVNLIGTFTVLALAAEEIAGTEPLEFGQRGVIVNTASVAAFEGQVGQAAYASSKGGVVGLTVPAARDLAQYGIRVNTVAPGIVDTPMLQTVSEEFRGALAAGIPFPQRLCRPDEYAQLVGMIIDHDYLNGETIRMDGALRMAPR
ncbi:SDR family NAD(P)-dependent oxidoreductase [Streptomyces mexicanus]|jgi:NAD(P)-dependent dehydrogenase (short-subunit alcohol dehydrogenase family)|uniref:SDR family NAD(P)-dependent oxidoreductase n=1 Tax=Streptomyces mexicanus TaxID=178566 RepID=A0A7X1HZV7_9ACTN|nr:SDR family NAD(P)-dependent oxidoreductase [Streptomyces mexicanus]MBC2864978.1 SDR family NAD(P)-dependent oxidoreductase [Streptomyces mexicanus]